MRDIAIATFGLLCAATPALAEPPAVVTDIAPVHSLVSRVMQGVGTPSLLVEPGASPHGYRLRPSEARALSAAQLVIWTSEAQEPWLEEAIDSLAPDAVSLELLETDGTLHLPIRQTAAFGGTPAHDHGGHDDDHAEGAAHADGHGDHADEHAGADHADHDDHADADHDDHAHADHDDHAHNDHDEHHHGDGTDPHAWLDPANAAMWLDHIAVALAEADPANAATYRANAVAGRADLEALEAEIAGRAAELSGGYVSFHDAYQYFEHRFDLNSAGALSASDATDPGPARLAELREVVADRNIKCIFAEPQFNPKRVRSLASDLEMRTGVMDPLGAALTPGPALYGALLTGLMDSLESCLND